MKKLSFFITVIGLFAFATAVLAYDDLITDDTSAVGEQGEMCARAGLLYLTAGDVFDKDGDKQPLKDTQGKSVDATQLRIPLKFRYGILEGLEAFAILPIVSVDNGTDSESGIGDIWLGAKWKCLLMEQITIRAALNLPTADEEKGLGNYDGFGIDIGAMSQCEISSIAMNGQLGLRYSGEEGDTAFEWKPGLGFYIDGEATYGITDALKAQLGLELGFVGEGESAGTEISDSNVNWIDLNLGAAYKIADNMSLRGDVLIGLTGTNYNANMGVLIGFGYGF